MKILGIDPGSRIMGFGIIKNMEYEVSGCVRLAHLDWPDRLREIFQSLTECIQIYQPDVSVVEQVFLSNNPNSALKLGQARGVAVAACRVAGLPVFEYSTRKVKQSVVGTGSASKSQVQYMVQKLLHLDRIPSPDSADALAMALCYVFNSKKYKTANHRIV